MDELISVVDAAPGRRRAASPRICLIIGQLGLGGTEKQVVLLAEGLHRRGIEVTVVVLTGEGPREAALRAAGVPVVHIGLQQPGDWTAVPRLFAAARRLTRYLRTARPDLVHAFLFHSYVLGALAARLAKVPVFVAGRRSLDDFKLGRRWVRYTEWCATRMTDLLVANAQAVAECARTTERVPADKLTVIYNGLPAEAFEPAQPVRLDTVDPVLLCVANLKSYKGHAILLEAAAILRERGMPCTLALAGDGPEREALDRQARELGVDARLLGSRTDVDRLLAAADIAVLPSLTEGLSNAVMEAMAAGKPVVATAVGGTPELLADGRGVLVPPGDPVALADALATVLLDPGYADRLGRAAREWSRTYLHADAMVAQHVVLYENLLEG
jgi:L-malate glycosyltransferase